MRGNNKTVFQGAMAFIVLMGIVSAGQALPVFYGTDRGNTGI